MSDIGIFIFGCCVFGIALISTAALIIGGSYPETEKGDVYKAIDHEQKQVDAKNKLAS